MTACQFPKIREGGKKNQGAKTEPIGKDPPKEKGKQNTRGERGLTPWNQQT